jgi:hypothetical protein
MPGSWITSWAINGVASAVDSSAAAPALFRSPVQAAVKLSVIAAIGRIRAGICCRARRIRPYLPQPPETWN